MSGPCTGWVPDHSLCADWATTGTPEQRTYADGLAVMVLWAATGRQFGLCDVIVRPCIGRQDWLYQTYPAYPGYDGSGIAVTSLAGLIEFITGCGCGPACLCGDTELVLPGPVDSVTTVTIDGVVLNPSAYRTNGDRITRQDGEGWPAGQDMSAVVGTTDTWSVRYLRGIAVPATLLSATGEYACELLKAITGGNCRLPARVQSISRQGVDVQMVDATNYLEQGLTGIATTDQLIRAYNPGALRYRPRVMSLDLPQFR